MAGDDPGIERRVLNMRVNYNAFRRPPPDIRRTESSPCLLNTKFVCTPTNGLIDIKNMGLRNSLEDGHGNPSLKPGLPILGILISDELQHFGRDGLRRIEVHGMRYCGDNYKPG